MESYLEIIKKDTCRHRLREDTTSWPISVSQFVQSLYSELKLPGWLKSGPVPYANERVLNMLNHLRASDDAARTDIWENTRQTGDDGLQQRLHVVFNDALADCARIRAVVEAEKQTRTPYPKESFIAVLVRNAMLNTDSGLCCREDVQVVLPRHLSGEPIPILKYMKKCFYAPFIISIHEDMPSEESTSDIGNPSSHDEDDSNGESELLEHPTMSEFLEDCERTKTPEEDDEEQEERITPSRFEAYFLPCPPSGTPPSVCHIPILCMADSKQLPVLMSSLLYHRRAWHISDPLIGLEFSKYDTTIRLYLGWLESDMSSGRVLPRVHLGEIITPISLDLSSPSTALLVSRLLCSLESHVRTIRDTVKHSVNAVIVETQSPSPFSWRIDTDVQSEVSASILEIDSNRDTIIKWAADQEYFVHEETMPPRQRADQSSLSGSATSMPLQQQLTFTQTRDPTPPSPVPSKENSLSIPALREPDDHGDSIPTAYSRPSCSAFAATTEKTDYRLFRWLFDRRVIPHSLPSDKKFCDQYNEMTGFIWPETWSNRDDLPSVDAALEPCVQELLESVAVIKTRPNGIKCIPEKDFPIDLRLLEQSFSAIFQASRRSREKKELQENVCEASWRHDHDRLLFDFFIRLVQPRRNGIVHSLADGQSIAHLEDPLSRPTLETTIRLPKNDRLERGFPTEVLGSMLQKVSPLSGDLRNLVESHGHTLDTFIEEASNAAYIFSHGLAWVRETKTESEAEMISRFGHSPLTGRCDALGRLLVELSNISPNAIGHLPLVVRAATTKSSASRGGSLNKASSSSLTVPVVSSKDDSGRNGTRYTMLSFSVSTFPQVLNIEQSSSAGPVDILASKVRRLQLGQDATLLELPILAVEYKKTSDNTMQGTNQIRMYLTASVKFLQAIGIKNIPVYGVQTDGPIVVLPVAVLRDDNFVYLFERLVERLDISTPLGAWHYATILCRLAHHHAKILQEKFDEVKEKLIMSLLSEGHEMEGWSSYHQMSRLQSDTRAKSPTRDDGSRKRTDL